MSINKDGNRTINVLSIISQANAKCGKLAITDYLYTPGRYLKMNKIISLEEVSSIFKDGMTVMAGGFMGVGTSQDLISAI